MNIKSRNILGLSIVVVMLFAVSACWADDGATIDETIEFRNGIVIRAQVKDREVPWQTVRPDGTVVESTRKISSFEELHFARETVTKKAQRIQSLVFQLGSRDYHQRMAAEKQLRSEAVGFRGILQAAKERAANPEMAWRLDQVLSAMPRASNATRINYDLAIAAGSQKEFGDAQNLEIEAAWRGHTILIERDTVRSIRRSPPELDSTAEPAAIAAKPLVWNAEGGPLKGARWIKFETGPDGESLEVGRSIGKTFAPWGCLLSTSITDSIVSVEKYNVGGPSGGLCAANHEPIYEGIMTIRFCQPGNPQAAAGVRQVGFWTSHISPGGTTLKAFDERGRLLIEETTKEVSRQFLGVESNVPIARVEVTPNVEIDPDFAIDDLMYDDPRPLAESGDLKQFTIVTRLGERLLCESLASNDQSLILKKPVVGPKELLIPQADIAVVVPPLENASTPETSEGCFVRLKHGSVLAVRFAEQFEPFTLEQFVIETTDISALWGRTESVRLPHQTEWEKGVGVVARVTGDTPFTDWEFGEKWIEATGLKAIGETTYAESPTVWFSPGEPRPKSAGLLRLISGDELVLHESGFRVVRWNADGIVLTRGEQEWTLPMKEIRSLLLPTE